MAPATKYNCASTHSCGVSESLLSLALVESCIWHDYCERACHLAPSRSCRFRVRLLSPSRSSSLILPTDPTWSGCPGYRGGELRKTNKSETERNKTDNGSWQSCRTVFLFKPVYTVFASPCRCHHVGPQTALRITQSKRCGRLSCNNSLLSALKALQSMRIT